MHLVLGVQIHPLPMSLASLKAHPSAGLTRQVQGSPAKCRGTPTECKDTPAKCRSTPTECEDTPAKCKAHPPRSCQAAHQQKASASKVPTS